MNLRDPLHQLPAGTLLINPQTGDAWRKVNDTEPEAVFSFDSNDWRSHTDSAFGWGSTGTLSADEYESLSDAFGTGDVLVAWTPPRRIDVPAIPDETVDSAVSFLRGLEVKP